MPPRSERRRAIPDPETDKALRIASVGPSCLSSTDFESTGTGYGMKIGYRTDHRQPLHIGDIMEAAGDHLDVAEFPDISRKAEMALRNSSQHTDIRANALYLYSDLHMAEEDWRLRGKGLRTFYKVSFEDDDLLHTGDFLTFDLVAKDIRAANDPSANVEKYWAGCNPSRYSEYLVRKATVLEVIREATSWKTHYQTAADKLRREPANEDWYRNLTQERED
jgi:hypothetical protein